MRKPGNQEFWKLLFPDAIGLIFYQFGGTLDSLCQRILEIYHNFLFALIRVIRGLFRLWLYLSSDNCKIGNTLSKWSNKRIRNAGKQEKDRVCYSCFPAFLISHLSYSISYLRATHSRWVGWWYTQRTKVDLRFIGFGVVSLSPSENSLTI